MLKQDFDKLNKHGVTAKLLCRKLNLQGKTPIRAKKYIPTNLYPIIRENINDKNVRDVINETAEELQIDLSISTL
jgi:hypothetical protein